MLTLFLIMLANRQKRIQETRWSLIHDKKYKTVIFYVILKLAWLPKIIKEMNLGKTMVREKWIK